MGPEIVLHGNHEYSLVEKELKVSNPAELRAVLRCSTSAAKP